MRCIACDKVLSYADNSSRQEDGSEEDMCFNCIGLSYTEYSYITDHSYIAEEDPFAFIYSGIIKVPETSS
jgi:hypothetical protein